MRASRLFCCFFVLAFMAGCGRMVVLSPAEAAARNAPDWTVRSQPAPAPAAVR